LKAAYASKNLADIEVAQNELNTAWTAASEDMYKASAEGGQPGPDAGAGAGPQDHGDTVTDVDFEEVKDESK
ncbi:MAG: molecular chaperone DnaK, partial [Mucilaginibacter sp.]